MTDNQSLIFITSKIGFTWLSYLLCTPLDLLMFPMQETIHFHPEERATNIHPIIKINVDATTYGSL